MRVRACTHLQSFLQPAALPPIHVRRLAHRPAGPPAALRVGLLRRSAAKLRAHLHGVRGATAATARQEGASLASTRSPSISTLVGTSDVLGSELSFLFFSLLCPLCLQFHLCFSSQC